MCVCVCLTGGVVTANKRVKLHLRDVTNLSKYIWITAKICYIIPTSNAKYC